MKCEPRSWQAMLAFCLALSSCSLAIAEDMPNTAPVSNAQPMTGVAGEINGLITTKQHPYLSLSSFANRAEDLNTLYKSSNYNLLWLGSANAEKNINEALKLLSDASSNGLNSINYDAQSLQEKLPVALALAPTDYKNLALYDTALSIALLRFSHDLHYGRVNPQGIDFNLKLREKLVDLPALLQTHLAQGTLANLPLAVEPKLKQYSKLKLSLATYRLLAQQEPELHLHVSHSVHQGESLAQSDSLRRFLRMVGDLPENSSDSAKSGRYSSDLVAGVKKFQQRHGINPDGILGGATVTALNVPLKQRVEQIELAMERLRWLPELSTGKSIIVNIPAFQLWAFDDIEQLNVDMPTMRVVVGKALKTQTPILMAEMRFVDFMPYWNVPYKIVNEEIVPKLLQNPGYLDAENMELVKDGKPVGFTGGAISLLKQGSMGIRQRPGKKNALGKVKFIFPNRADVYLHDTPASSLFSRSRRDFSHGCVRVAHPERLAEFVLKEQAGWDTDAIQKAMKMTKSQRVFLKQPIPVLFFYTTAFFDQDDKLAFYSDIYGHDTVLLEALKKPEDLSDQALFASVQATNATAPAVVEKAVSTEPVKTEEHAVE